MILQNVILAVLIGAVITGVVPLVGGIVLLATGKIKGTSFWAGVLAFFIASIATAIATALIILPSTISAITSETTAVETTIGQTIVFSIISAAILGFSMLILIKKCIKARTFKAAISAGLGYAIPQIITIAIGLVSIYATFAQINSGVFDQIYSSSVDMGFLTKEAVAETKAVYTEMTVTDITAQVIAAFGNVLIMTAAAILIMLFVVKRKAFLGTLAVIGGISVTSIVSAVIPNVLVASIIALAIGAAAFYFSYATREKIVDTEQPKAEADPFMQSISSAKEDN